MFSSLLKMEILDHLKTFRFGAALITTFVMVILSVWALGEDYLRRRDLFNTITEKHRQEVVDVFTPSLVTPMVWHEPSPLGIFATGEEQRFGNFVTIRREQIPESATEGLNNNEFLESTPFLDLLVIFTFVISIFGILFSYDAISGERERGTLKMLCTGRLRRGGLFTAKFLGINIILTLAFLLSFISGLLVLLFALGIGFTPLQWAAVLTMLAGGIIYGALFVSLGLMCSALARRSSTSLLISLLFWLVGIVVIPLAGSRVAETLIPLRPADEIRKLEEVTIKEVNEGITKYQRGFFSTSTGNVQFDVFASIGRNAFMFDGTKDAFDFMAGYVSTLEPLEEKAADRVGALVREHEAAKRRQASLAAALSSPSPAVQLRNAFTALAGTDINAYERFLESARRFRSVFIRGLWDKGYFGENAYQFVSRRKLEEISDEKRQERVAERNQRPEGWYDGTTTKNWDELGPLPDDLVPPFSFRGDNPDFETALGLLGLLMVMALILLAAGFVTFLKYDVR